MLFLRFWASSSFIRLIAVWKKNDTKNIPEQSSPTRSLSSVPSVRIFFNAGYTLNDPRVLQLTRDDRHEAR